MHRLLCSLALLAACGHSSPTASPDATPDAPRDAAAGGSLVVNAPPGSTVLFYDAGGTLIDRSVTNGNGIATGNGAAGGSVTAIPPTGTWYTWLDVGPADTLYTQPVDLNGPSTLASSVILPRDGSADGYGATAVGLDAYNNMPPATGTITAPGNLLSDAPAQGDVVAYATHGAATRYFVTHNAQIGAQIDLSSGTWSDPVPLDREVDHFPADTAAIAGRYSMLAAGRPLWTGQQYVMSTTTLAMHVDSPGTVGDGSAMTLWFQRGNGNVKHFWQATFNGADATIDLATVLPPDATSVHVQGNTVTWQVTGDPTHAVATWLAMDSGAAGGSSWVVIGPGDLRTFTLPQLPADVAPFPALADAFITFVGTNDPAGYTSVRTDPLAFDPETYGTKLPATPGIYRIGGR